MDKYEFSIKAEQIKKMVNQGDYKTAMQIADSIDWNRVRNANLLSSIAEIYEKNGEYEEAKDILLLAFERAPVGKRFLYKLSELSLRSGSIEDATEFYKEFLDVSPDDPRKYLLQYSILKAKGAKASQLIGPLEMFTSTELDEKWLYELAVLYGEAGREDDCVRTCDKMILLFGMGQYVDKAMDLKLYYRPVKEEHTAEEKEEEKPAGRAVPEEQTGFLDDPELPEREETVYEEPKEDLSRQDSKEEEQREETTGAQEEIETPKKEQEEPGPEESGDKVTEEKREEVEESAPENKDALETEKESFPTYHMIIEAETIEEAFSIAVEEIKYFHKEYSLDFKVAKIEADKLNEKGFKGFREKLKERDLIIEHAGKLKYSVLDEIEEHILHPKDASSIILIDEVDHFDRLAEDRPKFLEYFDIVSNQEEEEDSLEEVDLDSPAEEPEQGEVVEGSFKDIASKDEAGREDAEKEPVKEDTFLDEDEEEEQEYVPHKPSIFERPARPYKEVLEEEAEKERVQEEEKRPSQEEPPSPVEKRGEKAHDRKDIASMDIEDFARYCMEYAKSIDCSITEKGVTALYERIQLMEEDGIVLNKESARDLIEETADLAEKPSLGKKIGSLFRPKYDKDDKLILREEHFMG